MKGQKIMSKHSFYSDHCEKYYKWYVKNEEYFRADERRIKALDIFKKLSTAAVYAAYLILLGFLILTKDMQILRVVLVPAAVFFITTIIRSRINAPRPYEKYPIRSILHKSTKGNSCPSRHTACAVGIAFACLYISLPAGIAMLILSLLLAASRLVMGVHFPLDVVFGFAIAAVISIIGFWVI